MTRAGDGDPLWVRCAHGALDGTVVAFAAWTIAYELALAAEVSARATLAAWAPVALLAFGLSVWRATSRHREDPRAEPSRERPAAQPAGSTPRPLLRRGLEVAVGVSGVAATALWVATGGAHFLWTWALLALAAVSLVLRVGVAPSAPARAGVLSGWSHAAALCLVVVLAGFMLFVVRGNLDDVYYVNRSVWTAQHDTFALGDTMFGPETHPSTYALPIASIEGLLGALAGVLGVNAAVFSYLVAAPVFGVLSGWAAWRLVLCWVPRRQLLVFVAGVLLLTFDALSAVGGYSYSRMWTGKVIGLCLMVPLAWVHFTRLGEGRGSRRWALFMLLACGIGFVGMTPTAVIFAPLMSAAAVLSALVLRRGLRQQVLGAVAFSLAPMLSGVAVLVLSSAAVGSGATEPTPTVGKAFVRAWGHDPWVVGLLILGATLGVLAVRTGSARAMAAAAVLLTAAVLVPGVPRVLNTYTGTGPIYFRLLLLPPLAVLTGALLAVRLPDALPRPARLTALSSLSLVLLLVVVLGGTPPWSQRARGHLASHPTVDIGHPASWHDAEAVAALGTGQVVLMPPQDMQSMAILTTRSYTVLPRKFYLPNLEEKPARKKQRRLLARFATLAEDSVPPTDRVLAALDDLDVTTVCLFPGQTKRLDIARRAGYGDATRAGRLTCLQRSGTT